MTNWFCWHVGTVNDPKFEVVAKRSGDLPKHLVIAFWAYLLELAADASPKGSIESLDIEAASIRLGASEEELVAVLDAMEAKGMISACSIANWAKRQHGKSTERVREFRGRKKNETPETFHGVSVTQPPVSETDETTQTDRQTDITDRQTTASLISSIAQNKKMPSGGADFSTAHERKARWQQKIMDELRRTLPDKRAEQIIFAYTKGERWAVQEFEKVDQRIKSLRDREVA